jgi:4-hydroxy-2-oxoglutarate aldolase
VQGRLTPIHKEIVAPYGAVGVKAALDLLGYVGGPPRAPLRALGEKDRKVVARVMQEAGLL